MISTSECRYKWGNYRLLGYRGDSTLITEFIDEKVNESLDSY